MCERGSPGQGTKKGLRGPDRDPWECFQPKPFSVLHLVRSMRVPKGGCQVRDKKLGNIYFFSNDISGFLFCCCPAPPCPAQERHLEKYRLSRGLCPALHSCGERKGANYRSPNSPRIRESFKLGKSPKVSGSSHEPVHAQCSWEQLCHLCRSQHLASDQRITALPGAGAAPHFTVVRNKATRSQNLIKNLPKHLRLEH